MWVVVGEWEVDHKNQSKSSNPMTTSKEKQAGGRGGGAAPH